MTSLPRSLVIVAVGTLTLLGCAPPADDPGPPPPRWNVLMILVDTLRADRLGAYGYPRPTSPALDALAEDSVLFENAYSQAACTFPSVNSLLTSRPGPTFLSDKQGEWKIPDHLPTLPGVLAEHGYRSLAVSASGVVRATPSRINHTGGFGEPFEVFDESCHRMNADCVVDRGLHWIGDSVEKEQPFFLYLHFMDPHGPYVPPEGHEVTLLPKVPSPKAFIREGDVGRISRHVYGDKPVTFTQRDLAHLHALYDELIRYFDGELARMMTELEAQGLLENTLVIFLSDHGEELLEHGQIAHCRDILFQNSIQTPLIFRLPEGPRGLRHALPVQNLDVMPTVLDLLGIDPPEGVVGDSLAAYLTQAELPQEERFAYSAQGIHRAVMSQRYKLVLDLRDHSLVLYDLATDPLETEDVQSQHPEAFRTLRKLLYQWTYEWEGKDSEKGVEAAKDLERQLKAVGYLD